MPKPEPKQGCDRPIISRYGRIVQPKRLSDPFPHRSSNHKFCIHYNVTQIELVNSFAVGNRIHTKESDTGALYPKRKPAESSAGHSTYPVAAPRSQNCRVVPLVNTHHLALRTECLYQTDRVPLRFQAIVCKSESCRPMYICHLTRSGRDARILCKCRALVYGGTDCNGFHP